jgi:hypothetical protein
MDSQGIVFLVAALSVVLVQEGSLAINTSSGQNQIFYKYH